MRRIGPRASPTELFFFHLSLLSSDRVGTSFSGAVITLSWCLSWCQETWGSHSSHQSPLLSQENDQVPSLSVKWNKHNLLHSPSFSVSQTVVPSVLLAWKTFFLQQLSSWFHHRAPRDHETRPLYLDLWVCWLFAPYLVSKGCEAMEMIHSISWHKSWKVWIPILMLTSKDVVDTRRRFLPDFPQMMHVLSVDGLLSLPEVLGAVTLGVDGLNRSWDVGCWRTLAYALWRDLAEALS